MPFRNLPSCRCGFSRTVPRYRKRLKTRLRLQAYESQCRLLTAAGSGSAAIAGLGPRPVRYAVMDYRVKVPRRPRLKKAQAIKHTTGMAGEFLVAGELLRRGVMAAVTYGNAKKADVVAFAEGRSVMLEVKSTSEPKWVLGGTLPADGPTLWVLVYLPADLTKVPEYFILTGADLRRAVLPRHQKYMDGYRAKHGAEYAGKGVVSVRRSELDPRCLGAWEKVLEALGLPQQDLDGERVGS
jgi:hypothetical protein